LGVPPVLTPLGHLLFQAGVGFHIKDWYFSEGGSEGPRKLQGFKPLERHQAHARAQILARQIAAYLSQEKIADEGLHASVRALARQVLAALKRMEE
ncbi:MAG: DUF1122 family protein, partial [Chloroflexi bacterium]|nr:DUF1122 family protein [Chloroflexota bacterium]